MKKIIISIIFFLFIVNENIAQSEIEGLRYSQKETGGSARFVSMSGSFGALGGDLGAITINPASIGLFRVNHFSFTPQMVFDNSKAKYINGTGSSSDNYEAFNISNLGYVGSYLSGESTGLTSVNFGMSFNRVADFNQLYEISGMNKESSMIESFIGYSNGTAPEDLWNYIDRLAYDTYLTTYDPNYDDYYTGLDFNTLSQEQTKKKQTYGGMNEFDISLGASFSNKYYFGVSAGISSINYREESYYSELNKNLEPTLYDVKHFGLSEWLTASGVGMNLKIGAILRPVNWLRIGISLHSGTILSISEEYDTFMDSEVHYVDIDGVEESPDYEIYEAEPTDYDGYSIGPLISDYYIKTPGKSILSLAFVVNKMALINIDYERVNYSKINMDAFDFNLDDVNEVIKDVFRASNNLRIGVEVKNGIFSLRAGAAHYDSPYENEAFFIDPSKLSFSGGVGINKGNFYVDLAYAVFNYERTDYFYSVPEDYNLVGAEISTKKSKALATIGFRFN